MVANSLLAYASVNHLHYHFMCVAEPTLAARVVYIYIMLLQIILVILTDHMNV